MVEIYLTTCIKSYQHRISIILNAEIKTIAKRSGSRSIFLRSTNAHSFFPLGTVTRDPQLACVGEQVTVDCTLNVPGMNDMFLAVITNYIVGNSDATINAGFR